MDEVDEEKKDEDEKEPIMVEEKLKERKFEPLKPNVPPIPFAQILKQTKMDK